jgi:hypothetical protein
MKPLSAAIILSRGDLMGKTQLLMVNGSLRCNCVDLLAKLVECGEA